jgi:hypothetical protein
MIILAAVAAAWVLAPLRNATAPAGPPERPLGEDDPDRKRAGSDSSGCAVERAPGGDR